MTITRGGAKAARASQRKRLRNRLVRRSVKTYVTKAKSRTGAGSEPAEQGVVAAISSIDRAVSKGIIHKNKGARLKSRLAIKPNKE
jgi:small subunit ribosomal protein S20